MTLDRCPVCGADVDGLPQHLNTPPGKGCPETPMGAARGPNGGEGERRR